jgi:hypothetical protein
MSGMFQWAGQNTLAFNLACQNTGNWDESGLPKTPGVVKIPGLLDCGSKNTWIFYPRLFKIPGILAWVD